MFIDPILKKLHALENWLEHVEDRRSLLPLRWAGRALLIGMVLLSGVLALVQWPFAALARKLSADEATDEEAAAGEGVTVGEAEEASTSSVSRTSVSRISVSRTGVPATGPIDVGEERLSRLISSGDRAGLVDFWAEWCGPCLTVEGLLREFAQSNSTERVAWRR